MKTIKELPDLAKPLKQMDVMLQLERYVDDQTLLGYSIKKAFIDKAPLGEIAKMIKDQLRDNRQAVINCIPARVVQLIEDNF